MKHTGNDKDSNFYPIAQQFAQDYTKSAAERANLVFPSSHPMSRWDSAEVYYKDYIGVYGGTVDFKDLDSSIQSVAMAEYVGADGALGEATFEVGILYDL